MISLGLYTALITPFDSQGEVDEESFRFQLQLQKESADGILVLGATGEALTLTMDEKARLLRIVKEKGRGLHLIAGVTSASTAEALNVVNWLKELKMDAALVTPPHYNKPTQEGIFRHFEALSKKTSLPILVYNHKGRTGVNIDTSTLLRIAELPNVIGVKEASGDLHQIFDVIHEIKRKKDFLVFSGDDIFTFPMMALGADGVISVLSNAFPQQMKELVHSALKKDFLKAKEIHFHLLPLFKASNFETNPIPIKAMMNMLKLNAGTPRLPLTPLSSPYLESMEEILDKLELSLCEI